MSRRNRRTRNPRSSRKQEDDSSDVDEGEISVEGEDARPRHRHRRERKSEQHRRGRASRKKRREASRSDSEEMDTSDGDHDVDVPEDEESSSFVTARRSQMSSDANPVRAKKFRRLSKTISRHFDKIFQAIDEFGGGKKKKSKKRSGKKNADGLLAPETISINALVRSQSARLQKRVIDSQRRPVGSAAEIGRRIVAVDLWAVIFSFVDPETLASLLLTCRLFYSIAVSHPTSVVSLSMFGAHKVRSYRFDGVIPQGVQTESTYGSRFYHETSVFGYHFSRDRPAMMAELDFIRHFVRDRLANIETVRIRTPLVGLLVPSVRHDVGDIDSGEAAPVPVRLVRDGDAIVFPNASSVCLEVVGNWYGVKKVDSIIEKAFVLAPRMRRLFVHHSLRLRRFSDSFSRLVELECCIALPIPESDNVPDAWFSRVREVLTNLRRVVLKTDRPRMAEAILAASRDSLREIILHLFGFGCFASNHGRESQGPEAFPRLKKLTVQFCCRYHPSLQSFLSVVSGLDSLVYVELDSDGASKSSFLPLLLASATSLRKLRFDAFWSKGIVAKIKMSMARDQLSSFGGFVCKQNLDPFMSFLEWNCSSLTRLTVRTSARMPRKYLTLLVALWSLELQLTASGVSPDFSAFPSLSFLRLSTTVKDDLVLVSPTLQKVILDGSLGGARIDCPMLETLQVMPTCSLERLQIGSNSLTDVRLVECQNLRTLEFQSVRHDLVMKIPASVKILRVPEASVKVLRGSVNSLMTMKPPTIKSLRQVIIGPGRGPDVSKFLYHCSSRKLKVVSLFRAKIPTTDLPRPLRAVRVFVGIGRIAFLIPRFHCRVRVFKCPHASFNSLACMFPFIHKLSEGWNDSGDARVEEMKDVLADDQVWLELSSLTTHSRLELRDDFDRILKARPSLKRLAILDQTVTGYRGWREERGGLREFSIQPGDASSLEELHVEVPATHTLVLCAPSLRYLQVRFLTARNVESRLERHAKNFRVVGSLPKLIDLSVHVDIAEKLYFQAMDDGSLDEGLVEDITNWLSTVGSTAQPLERATAVIRGFEFARETELRREVLRQLKPKRVDCLVLPTGDALWSYDGASRWTW